MGFIELLSIGVGLSMDAFAVSVCKGLKMRKINYKHTALIGLFFGGFQALMPFIGWLLGKQFEQYITKIDHWIAFILLAFIGGKMAVEAIREKDDDEIAGDGEDVIDIKELFMLAIATSIDALAAITIIGTTTFVISVAGVGIGNVFGTRFKSKAELAGGIILIIIGVKILIEGLM